MALGKPCMCVFAFDRDFLLRVMPICLYIVSISFLRPSTAELSIGLERNLYV
jgi:hypothetical protein